MHGCRPMLAGRCMVTSLIGIRHLGEGGGDERGMRG